MVLRFLIVINRLNFFFEWVEFVVIIYGEKLLKEEIVIVFFCLVVLIENENIYYRILEIRWFYSYFCVYLFI